jgi:hypothetical protein
MVRHPPHRFCRVAVAVLTAIIAYWRERNQDGVSDGRRAVGGAGKRLRVRPPPNKPTRAGGGGNPDRRVRR